MLPQVCIQYRWVDLREIEITDITLPDHTDVEVAHEKTYDDIVKERLVPHNPADVVEDLLAEEVELDGTA